MQIRSRWTIAALVLFLVLAPVAAGAETGVLEGMTRKLVRGVANVATGCGEIVKQPWAFARSEGWRAAVLRGPFNGLGLCVIRTFGGMYEILTFPLPLPPGYVPLVEPDYVWQEWPGGGARPAQVADVP